jgi:Flp pilus assembly protein TadG
MRAVRDRTAGSFTLELAVIFPAFLLVLLLAVQAGLYFFARQLALSAARQGVDAARLAGHEPADGQAAATRFLHEQGGGTLADPAVRVNTPGPASVAVTVTGRPLAIVPGFGPQISQTARAPIERYTTDASGR